MIYPQLHFTGQVWRPPYEANSQLLQITSGCTWHKCKFCSLYHGTPFRMSPLSEVEELKNLRHMKLDSINIGIETAHDETLERMNKGYHASDILEQLSKLDEAGIRYNVFYLNGLGGKGKGVESAVATADILNQLHPCIINIVSLTIFPESQLYQEVLNGTYEEEPEIERLMEMRTLIDRLKIKVNLLGHHVSNTVPVTGALPYDRLALLREFDKAIAEFPEKELKAYRNRIWHL